MRRSLLYYFSCWLIIQMSACSKESENNNIQTKSTLVTVTTVSNQPIEIIQETIGTLEGFIDPVIAAEVSARVTKVYVSPGDQVKQNQLIATLDATDFTMQRNEALAEIARIKAQLENQTKIVQRNQALVNRNFISQNAVDNEVAQRNVLKEQLSAAKARVESINHDSSKSHINAPIAGMIEKRLVNAGDYVRIGDPIVQIISKKKLRVHLPFPEQFAAQLKPGLKIRLSTPASNIAIETSIKEVKPLIREDNRSIDVIADIDGADAWQAGGSVNGQVILSEMSSVFMVPEQSVVLRPVGEVVYIVRGNKAYQSIITTGVRQNGLIQIKSGLQADQTIVVDGAGFLTDNTPVIISQ